MGYWKDPERKHWTYKFQFRGKQYGARGFRTKAEARSARSKRQDELKKLYAIHPDNFKVTSISNNKRCKEVISILSDRYKEYLENPYNTMPDLFDKIMKDLDLPYSFNDVLSVARNANKRKSSTPAKLRIKILERDNHTCLSCGRKPPNVTLHVDHIVPVSRGGLTERRNLQTLCRDCNIGKSNSAPKLRALG